MQKIDGEIIKEQRKHKRLFWKSKFDDNVWLCTKNGGMIDDRELLQASMEHIYHKASTGALWSHDE